MQQIYWRATVLERDFHKVVKQLYWNHNLACVFSCKFAAYFQNTFFQDHAWRAASEYLQSTPNKEFIACQLMAELNYEILIEYLSLTHINIVNLYIINHLNENTKEWTNENSSSKESRSYKN